MRIGRPSHKIQPRPSVLIQEYRDVIDLWMSRFSQCTISRAHKGATASALATIVSAWSSIEVPEAAVTEYFRQIEKASIRRDRPGVVYVRVFVGDWHIYIRSSPHGRELVEKYGDAVVFGFHPDTTQTTKVTRKKGVKSRPDLGPLLPGRAQARGGYLYILVHVRDQHWVKTEDTPEHRRIVASQAFWQPAEKSSRAVRVSNVFRALAGVIDPNIAVFPIDGDVLNACRSNIGQRPQRREFRIGVRSKPAEWVRALYSDGAGGVVAPTSGQGVESPPGAFPSISGEAHTRLHEETCHKTPSPPQTAGRLLPHSGASSRGPIACSHPDPPS